MDAARALELVYGSLDHVNGIRPPDQLITKSPDVVLVGEDGALDSLALTTLILALEDRVREATGEDLILLDDVDLDAVGSRFRTPTTIAELIVEKLG